MSEKYKYYKINDNIKTINTIGELKDFISNNMSIPEEDFLDIVSKYLTVGADTEYTTMLIKKFRRQFKIKNILKDE